MPVMTQARQSSIIEPRMEEGWYDVAQSLESQTVLTNYGLAFSQFVEPISIQQKTLLNFYTLFDSWKQDTFTSSSTTDIAMHPAYQQIIGMGREALPYIFSELSRSSDYWFWALKAITRTDPVKKEDRGNIQEMRNTWLAWGKENGYI